MDSPWCACRDVIMLAGMIRFVERRVVPQGVLVIYHHHGADFAPCVDHRVDLRRDYFT